MSMKPIMMKIYLLKWQLAELRR